MNTMNLITITDPQGPAAEAYQSLRTNIQFSSLDQTLRTLLIAAAESGTDKSTALANLAVVMAQTGDRVIVVDGDLRRPRQHELFGVNNQPGLTTWLSGDGAAPLQNTAVENLQVLAAGPATKNPVALLSNKRLGEALAELTAQADYVICDAPPVLAVTDAALWATNVDGVVMLVNAGGTKREEAQRAKVVLEKVQANLLGVVLLDADKSTVMSGWAQG
jgi:capsular exopolysaccharide synthesis family protein